MLPEWTFVRLGTVALSLVLASPCVAQTRPDPAVADTVATGVFAPAGPPLERPVRVDAGGGCVVDLRQAYEISGTLVGSLEIDYRILVQGPCEVPPVPGKYAEEWIAYGRFAGTVDGAAASCSLTYTAHVRAGGTVIGRVVLSDGVEGELEVTGNFKDGELSYRGRVN